MRRLLSARRLAVTLAAMAALALPLLGTTPASAGTGPGPGTLAEAMTAAHHHHHGLRPEFFTLTIVNNNPGVVSASGPVRGIGSDSEKSGTLGVFSFTDPPRSVNVFHTDESGVNPVIDPRFCTATAEADGVWAFGGGTGIYSRATGFGTFHFMLFVVLPRKHDGRCNMNPDAQPVFFLVQVTGSGLAARN